MKHDLTKQQIKKMIAEGYRRTSNRFGLVSRIDREDWKQYCIDNKYPVDADWYRRCLSKDTVEVGRTRGREFPPSSNDDTGYIEREGEVEK